MLHVCIAQACVFISMKIIVGAGNTSQAGWHSLERNQLDIRDGAQWARLFRPNTLDAILSEHVLEHLTLREAHTAATNIYNYLKRGGYWRIAVPDGFNRNPSYQNWNHPLGNGQKLMRWFVYAPNEPCHQVMYNYHGLTHLLSSVGFSVRLLEWCDERGQFHRSIWSQKQGEVRRSFGHPYLAKVMPWTGVYNTSLIVDAIKV